MIALLLVTSLALADDIQAVEAGETITAPTKSFLLPERYYDRCLEKAELLKAAQEEIALLQAEVPPALVEADRAIHALDIEISLCADQVGMLTSQLAVGAEREKGLRAQRNILIGTGAVLVAVAILEGVVIANMAGQ